MVQRSFVRTLTELHEIRRRFAPPDTARKCAILRAIVARGATVRTWKLLDRLNDDLLFLCAFPDSPEVRALAVAALDRVEPALRRLSLRERAKADDSGIAGSASRYSFEYPAARWLAARYSEKVRIDWPAVENAGTIETLIGAGVARAEDDALDESELGARRWLRLAGRSANTTDLAALLSLAPRDRKAESLFARMYDAAGIPLRWDLAGSGAATTRNMIPTSEPACRTGLRRPSSSPVRDISTPLVEIRVASAREAVRLIAAGRSALAARCREVFATSCANPSEVWIAALGEGAELAIYGLPAHQRVSIEANYGYVLFVNGVPAAYGGVTPLYKQANTGINIFGPFRGSEGAFLWAQMLRAFRSLFGITRFVVNAVQFGEGNDEAIASGAYWFYWRLGFRPASAKLRRLAAAEALRIATGKNRRTSARTLRRLAVGDLHLALPGASRAALFDEPWLARCALLATKVLSDADPRSRASATKTVAKRVASDLGVRTSSWPAAQRESFARLAPVVALLPAVRRWSSRDKRGLVAMMRAKGGTVERDFVLRAAEHPRFFPELIALFRQARA